MGISTTIVVTDKSLTCTNMHAYTFKLYNYAFYTKIARRADIHVCGLSGNYRHVQNKL